MLIAFTRDMKPPISIPVFLKISHDWSGTFIGNELRDSDRD